SDDRIFAQGLRAGGGALRDRLRAAFPHERERLNALFEPGKRREGLTVTPAATPREGTVLSRVLAAPSRRTVVAAQAPRPRGRGTRVALALGLLAAAGTAGAVGGRERAEAGATG